MFKNSQRTYWLGAFFALVLMASPLAALEDPGTQLKEVGLESRLGERIDSGLEFTDYRGSKVLIQDILSTGKPTLLVPVYYLCPRLCGLLLDGVVALINKLPLRLGKDYQVVAFSFDSSEGVELARDRAKEIEKKVVDAEGFASWRFLVGEKAPISTLTKQLGFLYRKDGQDYSHTAVFAVLTPEGEISQYFTGVTFKPWDVKLALVEASNGGIGSPLDHFLLYCFRFDPTKGKYTWAALNVMRAGGAATLVLFGAFVYCTSRRRKTRSA